MRNARKTIVIDDILRVLKAAAASLILVLGAGLAASADTVVLKGGDRISGIVTMKPGLVSVKPSYTEAVLVPRSEIAEVRFDRGAVATRLSEIDDTETVEIVRGAPDHAAHPEAGSVALLDRLEYVLEADGRVWSREHTIVKVFEEREKDRGNFVLMYDPDAESAEVEVARSINGESVDNLKPDSVKRTSAYSEYPLYDRREILQFTLPSVKEGSIVEKVIYRRYPPVSVRNPFAIDFTFRGFEPVRRSELIVRVPAGTALAVTETLLPAGARKTRETRGVVDTLTFVARDLEEIENEPELPPFREHFPNVRVAIPHTPTVIARELGDELAKIEPSPAVAAAAQAAAVGKTGARERARALYNRLIADNRIVSVPLDINDLHPIDPGRILTEKYGSEHDRLVLLRAELRALGLASTLLLGRSWTSGKIDERAFALDELQDVKLAIHLPAADAGGRGRREPETVYVNGGSEFQPFGVIEPSAQDSPYLVLGDDFPGHPRGSFVKLPVGDPEPEREESEIDVILDASGHAEMKTLSRSLGSLGAGVRSRYKYSKPEERRRGIEKMLSSVIKNTKLEKFDLSDVVDLDLPVTEGIAFRARDYAVSPGGKYLVFPIPFCQKATDHVGKIERKSPLFRWHRVAQRNVWRFKLPDGFRVRYHPKDLTISTKDLTYTRRFETGPGGKAGGRTLVMTEEHTDGGRLIPLADYAKYREQVNETGKLERDRIVLERDTGAGGQSNR